MIIDQEINGAKILTNMSHNSKGNPHPQYQVDRTYSTKNNVSGTNYIKIFDGNFQSVPNNFSIRNREYNRLLYSAYIYSMSNDDVQTVTRLTFFAIAKYDGNFAVDVRANNIIGSTFKGIVAYKDISEEGVTTGYKSYNLKVYVRLTRPNERVAIKQELYDVCNNYEVPFHLECSKNGTNWAEKLDALYKDLGARNLLTETELNAEIEGYAKIERDSSKMTFEYDYEKKGIYLLAKDKTEKIVTNVEYFLNMNPDAKLGKADVPWCLGYFKTINLKSYDSIKNLPSEALDGTICILNNGTKKCLIFKQDGNWYDAIGTQLS